jgi:hypothetical protein
MSKQKIATEEEWLASTDPVALLRRAQFRSMLRRKSRLFAVACCRRIWDLMVDDRSRQAVDVAERHADGMATDDELRTAAETADEAHRALFDVVGKAGACIDWAAVYVANPNPFHAATNVSWMAAAVRGLYEKGRRDSPRIIPCAVRKRSEPLSLLLGKWEVIVLEKPQPTGANYSVQAELVRDIFPNPFQPPALDPIWRNWNGGAMVVLAQEMYQHRDFRQTPLLADMLEDAGCTDPQIFDHLRGPGPHVRGCWLVDLILSKDR